MSDRNYPLQRNSISPVPTALNASSEPSDLALIRLSARGDEGAFHQLVDRHAKRLFRIALSLAASRSDAEDVLQETLAGAFRNIKGFSERSSVKTWLTSILMRQAAKSWHRTRHSRTSLSIDSDQREHRDGGDPSMVIGSANEDTDRRLDLATVLKELSPQHREIIVLREIEQLSYDEIAKTLGMPRGTVESRIHRARLELRRRLDVYAV